MKAISIKNPYATQILRGSKTIEYRSWDTKHRGDLLICSGANPKVPGMLSGYALYVVNLVNTTYNAAEETYEWELTDVCKIKVFPVKGKLNFFDVEDALIHYPGEKKTEEADETPISPKPIQNAIPQMPVMPKMIDNINLRVRDDLEETITKKNRLRIAAACFSIYAYEELKRSLSGIEDLQFIFTSPTFTTDKAQLQHLQEEVVDIEEMSTGISIMDLDLNEFRLDILDYIKQHLELEHTPMGLHVVAPASADCPLVLSMF